MQLFPLGNADHNFSTYISVIDSKCYGKNRAKKGAVWRHGQSETRGHRESERGVLVIIYRTSEFRTKCHRLFNLPLLKGNRQTFLL